MPLRALCRLGDYRARQPPSSQVPPRPSLCSLHFINAFIPASPLVRAESSVSPAQTCRKATSRATPGVSPAWPHGHWSPKRQMAGGGRVLRLGMAKGWGRGPHSEQGHHVGRELKEAGLLIAAPGGREEDSPAVQGRSSQEHALSSIHSFTRSVDLYSGPALGHIGDPETASTSPGKLAKANDQGLVSGATRFPRSSGRAKESHQSAREPGDTPGKS